MPVQGRGGKTKRVGTTILPSCGGSHTDTPPNRERYKRFVELSNKGARGLMQLMPGTATRYGVTDSYDPTANIYGGVRYLKWLLQTFDGNADFAVAAYNAGEGNVWKYNGVPPFRETINYINRIAKHIRASMAATPKVAEGAMR